MPDKEMCPQCGEPLVAEVLYSNYWSVHCACGYHRTERRGPDLGSEIAGEDKPDSICRAPHLGLGLIPGV